MHATTGVKRSAFTLATLGPSIARHAGTARSVSSTRNARYLVDRARSDEMGSFVATDPISADLGANLATCDLDGNQFIWAALRHPTELKHDHSSPINGKQS